jgi:aryl-alcohol dehydrogenase-like predicted oxidoreductase
MPLKSRALGRAGLQVPELCLGTMTFGFQCDEETSFAILDRAFDNGIRFVDSADVYPLGGSSETVGRTEEIVGRWMRERRNRDSVILATKCAGAMGPGPNDIGLSRYHILRAVEASLRRLGTDTIDLYQVHGFDPRTPIEETLRALEDLVRSGKTRYVGCSNYSAWRLAQALWASERLGTVRYDSVQPRFNLLYREIETELLPLCRSEGLGVIVYNPMAGGFLSGKYKKGDDPWEGSRFLLGTAGRRYQQRYWHDANFDAVDRFREGVSARGLTPASVAIAWVLAQPGISSAIVGASSAEQLSAPLEAVDLDLDEELAQICDRMWWSLPRRPLIEGYR